MQTEESGISYEAWIAKCEIGDVKPESSGDASLSAERFEFPAEFIRRAVVEDNLSQRRILSGIRITNAGIFGDLHLENLTVGFPIYVENCSVNGSLHIWRMKAKTFSLNGTVVKGGIDVRSSKFEGHLLMRAGFECQGPLLARDLNVNGTVDLTGASLAYDGISESVFKAASEAEAFSFSRSRATSFYWRKLRTKPMAKVNFRDAFVDSFNHDIGQIAWTSSWPMKGQLILEGFRYGKATGMDVNPALAWLDLQGSIAPSSYAALAKSFQTEHSFGRAEEVLAKAKRDEVANISHPIRRWFNKLVYGIVGYGKTPETALWILLACLGIHVLIVFIMQMNGYIQPSTNSFLLEPCFYGPGQDCSKDISTWSVLTFEPNGSKRYLPPAYPKFEILEFGLETFFPGINLGQREYWEPSTSSLRLFLSITSACGFFAGGAFIGAITGLINPKLRAD